MADQASSGLNSPQHSYISDFVSHPNDNDELLDCRSDVLSQQAVMPPGSCRSARRPRRRRGHEWADREGGIDVGYVLGKLGGIKVACPVWKR